MKNSAVSIIFLLFLSGCIFAPGMNMDENSWKFFGPPIIKVQGIDTPVSLIEITHETILDQSIDKELMKIPEELLVIDGARTPEYKLGINDKVLITVWGVDEFNVGSGSQNSTIQPRQVRADGTIFFPYAGVVKVVGLTVDEVRVLITDQLEKYFNAVQIDVSVADFLSKKVLLTGGFQNGGSQKITSIPLTLSEAIEVAGGATGSADLSDLRVIRDGFEFKLDYLSVSSSATINNLILKDDDIIHLPNNYSNRAYIFGEVQKPSSISIVSDKVTLTDLIGLSGGLLPNSSSGREVYVIRGGSGKGDHPKVYKLNAKSPASMLLASNFLLEAQDVVFVGPAELSRWNRTISQIFPFARLLNVVDDLNNE